jgi:hypothetical protein
MKLLEDSLHAGAAWSCRRRHQLRSFAIVALCAAGLCARASAQSKPALPRAVVLTTSGAQASSAGALDSVIQSALEELDVVNIVAKPGLDLSAVQLVIDCVAETSQCLRAVTTQQAADVLIAPSLARTASELVLSFLRFDARGDGEMRRVSRRQPGQVLSSATLDAVPEMLRELFDLPPVPKPAETPATAPSDTLPGPSPLPEPPMEAPSAQRGAPLGPLLLAAGGVLVIGSAAVLGATVKSSQHEYDKITQAPMPTRDQIDQALDTRDSARTRATLTNVLLGVGSAGLVAAGIWLAVDLTRPPERAFDGSARLAPWVGPHQLGLVLTERGAGL